VFLLLEDYGALAARIIWRRRYRVGLQFAVRHPALLALASEGARGESSRH